MPITLQTTIAHRRNQQISVNGNSYLIDGRCCIVVDDDDFADAEKLLKTGEWTDKIASVALSTVSRIPMPGDAMRGAVEFVDLLMGDEALAERVRGLRSFRSLQSLAQNLHFRFTEDEYRLATEAVQRAQTTPLKRAAAEPVNVEDEGANESTLPQLPKKPQAKAPAAKKGKDAAPKASSKIEKSGAPKPLNASSSKVRSAKPTSAEPAVGLASTELSDDALPEVLEEERTGDWPDPVESMGPKYLRRMADSYGVKYDPDIEKVALIDLITKAMYADD